ncbi:MAG: methyltransferase domain-containing protein [Phycisphaerales bacterium]
MNGAPPDGFVSRAACPLCDAGRERASVHIDFADIPVLKCGACGFIYPAFVMTPEGMKRYYREVFASPWHRKGQELNSFVNEAALRRLIDLRGVRTFLDVGTGYGFLLRRLSDRHGIDGVGTEPSVQEAAWGNEHLGVRIIERLVGEAGLAPASFDAVACFEVIEHVPDPRAFVAELASLCRPGGWVIINTDNFESAAVRRLGPRFAKWIPHSHVSDFSPATLKRCIESVPGLRVEATLSYTAWENALRAGLSRFQSPRPARACFSLERELGREMNRTYRFWPMRVAAARAWFALTHSADPGGSMMYLAARKA